MAKEYIERDAALAICQKEYEERLHMRDYCGDSVAWNIGGAIKAIPAADVVEVVRCKDCKYQRKKWHTDKRMKEGGYWIYSCEGNDDPFVSHTVNGDKDEFCCYGERKGGDGNA